MKIRRPVILYALGLSAAFGLGWMVKPETEGAANSGMSPVSRAVGENAGGQAGSSARSAAMTQTGETVTEKNWVEIAARDMAEVQAAMKPGEVNAVLVAKLHAVLNIGEPSIRMPRWQALLAAMRPEDVEAVRDIFHQNDKEGRWWTDEFSAYWQQRGIVDGAVAAEAFANGKYADRLASFMAGWGRSDPGAALEWVRGHPGKFNTQEALRNLVYGAGNKKASEAEALLLANAGDPQLQFLYDRVAHMKVYQEGMSGAKPWFEQLAAGSAPDNYKQSNMRTLVNLMSERTGGASAAEFAGKFVSEPWLPPEAGSALAREWKGAPADNLAKLEKIASPQAQQAAGAVLASQWAAHDVEGLSLWLTMNRTHPFFQEGTRALVKEVASTDPEAAKAWSKKIREPE